MQKKPFEPDLKDILDLVKRDIMLSLNCHHLGKIEQFNKENQTARVRIVYGKKVSVRNEAGEYIDQIKDYPLLLDCPVFFLRGGSMGIKIPPKEGDDCLLLFNDRDIDNWFEGATSGELNTSRTHSMTDALCVVGFSSKLSRLSDIEDDILELFNKNAKIQLTEEKIKLFNQIESLNDIIQDLVTELANMQIAVTGVQNGSGATTGTVSPANIANLTQIASRFGGLLE